MKLKKMEKRTYQFSASRVKYFFDARFTYMKELVEPDNTVLVTDENVFRAHQHRFKNWNTVVLKPGEEFKVQSTADALISQLIAMKADRSTTLVGVGGGVVTDLTGYVASIFMRGIRFGFVPTSLLAMVDASIGGKNGIDVDIYKNMVGVIRQPEFILFDMQFLSSLPQNEWENGFAEIIKHACIKDEAMFCELESHTLKKYRAKKKDISALVKRNAVLKTGIVRRDEFEKNERKLLNFGHTLGHALENQYEISHGQAVAIGMTYAAVISEIMTGFRDASRVAGLLLRYDLPTFTEFDRKKVFHVLRMDKKRVRKEISFILLGRIGKGMIRNIPLNSLEGLIDKI